MEVGVKFRGSSGGGVGDVMPPRQRRHIFRSSSATVTTMKLDLSLQALDELPGRGNSSIYYAHANFIGMNSCEYR